MIQLRKLIFLFLLVLIGVVVAKQIGKSTHTVEITKQTFELDRESNVFLKDGAPFRYVSGSIHYFRVHPLDWRDRLRKLRYAGCNAVETYIEWSTHEPELGSFNFAGNADLFSFLAIAQEEDLLVILRPGPFIDAERDMGGLPYWLLRENPKMVLRSMDSSYLNFVDRYYNVLFPMLVPLLYQNGGPIIMMQVENEYGSYFTCDFSYTAHLRDLMRSLLGDQVILFTTDGGGSTDYLKCGRIANVYATVDFGPTDTPEKDFAVQRLFEPTGPLINSEYYPGWLDHWGYPHSKRSSSSVASCLDAMLALNASVNIYVFHGGTSFGMSAGSNMGSRFQACPTSYDYDAPLNEAGDPTEKYYAIRNITEKYVTLPNGTLPPASQKYAYGDVPLSIDGGVLQVKKFMESVNSSWPLTFEAMSVPNGIVVYSTIIKDMFPDPARLTLNEIHDRGYVFVGNQPMGIVTRELELYEIPIFAKPGQTLTIVAESQGRLCYGNQINDFKGLTTNVTIGSITLADWEMTSFSMADVSKIYSALNLLRQKNFGRIEPTVAGGMAFYSGVFNIPVDSTHPMDTFLKLDGWTKGYVWVNGFLLGRYWPVVGPQITLYVPHGLLQTGSNSILVLELEAAPCTVSSTCKVFFLDTPEIDGPTPEW